MNIPTILNLEFIQKLNDEGKNSTVYLMKDTQLDAVLVVKCIPKSCFTKKDEYFAEAAIMYEVQHPNIVKIQHASEDKDIIFFSMPHYRNGSMESLINRKFLTVREIIQYALDFLTGLQYVHTKGLIHFDIKPTNILIGDNGKALLTDFGLSKYTDSSGLSSPNAIYPIHIPPEMLSGSLMSIKADIYQVGMTLYRMCNGNECFNVQLNQFKNNAEFTNAVIKEKFPDRKFYLPHIPKKLRNIIRTVLSTNPDNRYTVIDLANALSSVDKNLDIAYYIDKNTRSERWEYASSSTHKNCISLVKRGNTWEIQGEKIRLADNKKQSISSFCSSGYTTRYSALKQIEAMISQLNI